MGEGGVPGGGGPPGTPPPREAEGTGALLPRVSAAGAGPPGRGGSGAGGGEGSSRASLDLGCCDYFLEFWENCCMCFCNFCGGYP